MRQFLREARADTGGGKTGPAKVVSLAPPPQAKSSGAKESPWRLFWGVQLSESEAKTCFLKMEWWLAGETDSTVGGSMVTPVSLQAEALPPSLHTRAHARSLGGKALEMASVDSCCFSTDTFVVSLRE